MFRKPLKGDFGREDLKAVLQAADQDIARALKTKRITLDDGDDKSQALYGLVEVYGEHRLGFVPAGQDGPENLRAQVEDIVKLFGSTTAQQLARTVAGAVDRAIGNQLGLAKAS